MKKIFTTFIFALLFMPNLVFGATYFFNPPVESLGVGSQFTITLELDPEDEFINAIEGVINFPTRLLKVVNISSENSIVNAWIVEPKVDGGEISFSGIIPGGFDGVRKPLEKDKFPGTILSITFEGRRVGSGEVTLEEVVSLRNDGEGSEVLSSTVPSTFEIEGSYPPKEYGNLVTVAIIIIVLAIAILPILL